MSSRHSSVSAVCLGIWVALAGSASCEEEPRAVLVIMDDVTVGDLATGNPPHLQELTKRGGIGLLNVQSFSGGSFHRGCLTIGSGAKATGSEAIGEAYNGWEPLPDGGRAEQAYQRRTGRHIEGADIVHLGIGRAGNANAKATTPARLGALGEALRDASVACAVIGNSDTSLAYVEGKQRRDAASILMDASGRVWKGNVSKSLLAADANCPRGLRANLAAYREALDEFLSTCRVVVVDVGDPFRAEAFRSLATAEQGERLKCQAVEAADALVGEVMQRLALERDLLIVLAPSVPLGERYRMAPVVAAGPGIEPQSWLSAPSTRRPGIVALTDIAPSLLAQVDVPVPSEFVGRPLRSVPGRGGWDVLHVVNESTAAMDRHVRRQTLIPVGVWQGIMLLLLGLSLSREGRDGRRWLLRVGGLTLVASPVVVFLAKPLVPATLALPEAAVLLTLLALIGVAAVLARTSLPAFTIAGVLAGLTAAAMVLDTLTGARLSLNSVLGYSSYFGGRYYGVGNIVGSALIGAPLLSVAAYHARRVPNRPSQWAVLLALLAATALVIGHPGLGANVGCALSAVFAFGTYAWVLSGRTLRARFVVVLGVVVVAILAVQIAADLRAGPEESSHLGRLVNSASAEGTHPVVEMITSKLRVLLRSFKHAYWSFAVLGAVVGWGLFCFTGRRDLVARYREAPALRALVSASFLGGLVALLLNDSGPACPAVITCFGVGGALLWLLDQVPGGKPPSPS